MLYNKKCSDIYKLRKKKKNKKNNICWNSILPEDPSSRICQRKIKNILKKYFLYNYVLLWCNFLKLVVRVLYSNWSQLPSFLDVECLKIIKQASLQTLWLKGDNQKKTQIICFHLVHKKYCKKQFLLTWNAYF